MLVQKNNAAFGESGAGIGLRIAVDNQNYCGHFYSFIGLQNQRASIQLKSSDQLTKRIRSMRNYPRGLCPVCGGYQP
jgi:hypothetical protein